jgi:hypothetical protein
VLADVIASALRDGLRNAVARSLAALMAEAGARGSDGHRMFRPPQSGLANAAWKRCACRASKRRRSTLSARPNGIPVPHDLQRSLDAVAIAPRITPL